MLYDAGWIRLGWPEEIGGLGGRPILRSVVSEELAAAGYPPPFSFATQEVLGPAVAEFARPAFAADVLPRLLRGDETWCQGFSEPGAGSDLASLRLKAVAVEGGWRVSGEKIWTSWAQFADRCVLLARTGPVESAHRGISAFLLDMATPGIQVSPLRSMNGDDEFCSLYFDDVLIPEGRLLGAVDGGWAVAMYVLAGERGAAAWQRQIWLRSRLTELAAVNPPVVGDEAIGEAFELLTALRLLSRRTVQALSDGDPVGSTTSLDKLAMSTAEKFLFDAALTGVNSDIVFGGGTWAEAWRNDYLYSRASSIYGGAAEIQRNIIAERLLGLPR
ncbi:acyl-CoA dehydrogenase family protein [Nocardia nova]|uniref:acyl-CoA dehydrogenase family protein n=1 Tax=Nocardia nova TaxID=37330 RepID=UPI0037A0C912